MLSTSIGRLRVIGITEGASFLLLLGVAMPLKYIWALPLAVRIVGAVHGALWLLYLGALFDVRRKAGWPPGRVLRALIASVLPFGPFVLDGRLRAEQHAAQQLAPPAAAWFPPR